MTSAAILSDAGTDGAPKLGRVEERQPGTCLSPWALERNDHRNSLHGISMALLTVTMATTVTMMVTTTMRVTITIT